MSDLNTGKANGVGTEQAAGTNSVQQNEQSAAAKAELKRSRIREVKLRLEGDDHNGLHLRDHSLHLRGSLPLSGTDGNRPSGTIAKG